MKEIVPNYLWIDKFTDIDNEKLYQTCLSVDSRLRKEFPPIDEANAYGCFTSYYHYKYNLLTFACTELHKLYGYLLTRLCPHLDQNTQYYVRCWANLFDKDANIDWHSHWPSEAKAYHGFYCVNTEGESESYTDYRIPGSMKEIRIMSEDGLLVFGKSDGDEHRSSPWENIGKYRITIAFDIIPFESLGVVPNYDPYLIHDYIPLSKV